MMTRMSLIVLVVAIILAASVGCRAVAKGGAGAGARFLGGGGDIDCSENNSPSVEWDGKPTIINGTLTLQGRLTDGARLHDPNTEIKLKSGETLVSDQKYFLPSFSLIRLKSGDIDRVATIWPPGLQSPKLESEGSDSRVIYADMGDFVVSYEPNAQFSVKVIVPPSAQQGEGTLLALVWPPITSMDNPPDPIGVECL